MPKASNLPSKLSFWNGERKKPTAALTTPELEAIEEFCKLTEIRWLHGSTSTSLRGMEFLAVHALIPKGRLISDYNFYPLNGELNCVGLWYYGNDEMDVNNNSLSGTESSQNGISRTWNYATCDFDKMRQTDVSLNEQIGVVTAALKGNTENSNYLLCQVRGINILLFRLMIQAKITSNEIDKTYEALLKAVDPKQDKILSEINKGKTTLTTHAKNIDGMERLRATMEQKIPVIFASNSVKPRTVNSLDGNPEQVVDGEVSLKDHIQYLFTREEHKTQLQGILDKMGLECIHIISIETVRLNSIMIKSGVNTTGEINVNKLLELTKQTKPDKEVDCTKCLNPAFESSKNYY